MRCCRLEATCAALFTLVPRPSLGFVSTGEEFDPLADAGGSRHFAILAAAAAAG